MIENRSMLARDSQSVVLYDQKGKFAGTRRSSSKRPIVLNGTKIIVVDTIGRNGLNLKIRDVTSLSENTTVDITVICYRVSFYPFFIS